MTRVITRNSIVYSAESATLAITSSLDPTMRFDPSRHTVRSSMMQWSLNRQMFSNNHILKKLKSKCLTWNLENPHTARCIKISACCCLILLIVVVPVIMFQDNSIGTDEEVKHYPTQKIANTKAEWAAMSSEQELSWCGVIRSRFVDDEAWRFTKRNFASQDAQDWLLFSSMFRNMEGGGVYVDLAANDPRWISNTFFLDRCVGWTGLCIEADPKHVRNLMARRKCKMFEGCIWNVSQEMTFEFNNGSGAAGLQGHNKLEIFRQESTPRKMVCSTLQHELERNDIQHVDYLSLDIEGAEIEAMKGVDFGKTRIDVITAEVSVCECIPIFCV